MTHRIKSVATLAVTLATSALVLPIATRAQMRGAAAPAMAGHAVSVVRVAPAAVRPAPVAHATSVIRPNLSPNRNVPGLGFDYTHLAAINPRTQQTNGRGRRAAGSGFIIPIFTDAFPYDYGHADSQQPAPPDDDQGSPAALASPITIQPQSAPPDAIASPAPAPEAGQFILVRLNGQITMAVAFTISGSQLTYIATDGTRRSFALDELDQDATRQMNEANGHLLNLPNT